MKPRELEEAEMIDGLLQRYGGYTLSTLLEEHSGLLRVMAVVAAGAPDEAKE